MGKTGSYRDISDETGIPMGEYSGKAPAIVNYSIGMGLIDSTKRKSDSNIETKMTPFGEIVYLEDKYLSEPIVQWLAHMNLCREDIGARTWYELFAVGVSLGSSFTKSELRNYLAVRLSSSNKKGRIGPMINAYLDDAALARADVLSASNGNANDNPAIKLNKAPIRAAYAAAYAAYITDLFEQRFVGDAQVPLNNFNDRTKMFNICRWKNSDIGIVFELLEKKGFFSVDRQREPWVIEKRYSSQYLWPHIFDDLA